MPPKHDGKRKPANIIVGRPAQTNQTFNDTSLLPFLRAYTRMSSRDTGGGERQFMDEFNLARRIVEEIVSTLSELPHPPYKLIGGRIA